uniref:Large ribosomal subunit protein P2 n=1 Tax=Denticeps clupeoides TaxID=299321 RepID=A0AAY4BHQ9_9TELE
MRYVAAYLLAALAGKDSPQAGDIKKILGSVGIETDDTRMEKVISELSGKSVEDVIAQGEMTRPRVGEQLILTARVAFSSSQNVSFCPILGYSKLASVPSAEEKKEEKKDESEESDDDMGFGLFD